MSGPAYLGNPHDSPMTDPIARGQFFRAYPGERPARQVFIKVVRVARDASWADIMAFTWAVIWRKRQPLRRGRLPFPAERFDWDRSDLTAQQMDWERERAALATPEGTEPRAASSEGQDR